MSKNHEQPNTTTTNHNRPRHQEKTFSNLNDKVVLVTGASSGIGGDFCLDLAQSGCRIIAAARRVDRLKSLCDQINGGRGVRAVAVELDVSADGKRMDKSVQQSWDAFGRIDVLVNNAGIRGNVKSPLDTTEEEWDTTFKTNLSGLWLVSKSVCIRMRDAKIGGSIINISSIAGLNRGQLPGSVAYTASKAGVNALTKILLEEQRKNKIKRRRRTILNVMALELGKFNIRVNSISPGLFRSEITESLMEKDWLIKVALKTVPLRTFGTTDPALTSLVRYLIHDSSEYITGNIYIVDAGATLPGVPIFSSL